MNTCLGYYLWGVATPFLALIAGILVGVIFSPLIGDEIAVIEKRHGEKE